MKLNKETCLSSNIIDDGRLISLHLLPLTLTVTGKAFKLFHLIHEVVDGLVGGRQQSSIGIFLLFPNGLFRD
jgi:hypothetical protein